MENLLIWKFLLTWLRDTEAKPNPNGGLELAGREFDRFPRIRVIRLQGMPLKRELLSGEEPDPRAIPSCCNLDFTPMHCG